MSPSSDDSNISGRLFQPTELPYSPIVILESALLTCTSFTKLESGLVVAFFLLLWVSSFPLGTLLFPLVSLPLLSTNLAVCLFSWLFLHSLGFS